MIIIEGTRTLLYSKLHGNAMQKETLAMIDTTFKDLTTFKRHLFGHFVM